MPACGHICLSCLLSCSPVSSAVSFDGLQDEGIDRFGDDSVPVLVGMDGVGLVQGRLAGHVPEEEGNEKDIMLPGRRNRYGLKGRCLPHRQRISDMQASFFILPSGRSGLLSGPIRLRASGIPS